MYCFMLIFILLFLEEPFSYQQLVPWHYFNRFYIAFICSQFSVDESFADSGHKKCTRFNRVMLKINRIKVWARLLGSKVWILNLSISNFYFCECVYSKLDQLGKRMPSVALGSLELRLTYFPFSVLVQHYGSTDSHACPESPNNYPFLIHIRPSNNISAYIEIEAFGWFQF